jgi:hypothetical protein
MRVEELSPDDWHRLRDIRLAALRNDGHAFGGNLEAESAMTETEWRAKFESLQGSSQCSMESMLDLCRLRI